MEILSLLPILLFFLFVIATILRTKNKIKGFAHSKQPRSNPEMNLYQDRKGEKKKAGWKNRLMDTVAEIQREIKKAQEEVHGKPGNVPHEGKSEKRASRQDFSPVQPPPVPSEKKKKTVPDNQKPQQASQPVEIPESKIKPDLQPFANPTRQQLRNAVVWSEILAPPKALRKDQDNFNW